MKAIRWIQNVAAVVAIAMAVSLADGIGITFKEACTAGIGGGDVTGTGFGGRKED